MQNRRGFLLKAASFLAAPAIVQASSLMPVKMFDYSEFGFIPDPLRPGRYGVFWGSGAPTLNAVQGSLYLRTDGTPPRTYVHNGVLWFPLYVS